MTDAADFHLCARATYALREARRRGDAKAVDEQRYNLETHLGMTSSALLHRRAVEALHEARDEDLRLMSTMEPSSDGAASDDDEPLFVIAPGDEPGMKLVRIEGRFPAAVANEIIAVLDAVQRNRQSS